MNREALVYRRLSECVEVEISLYVNEESSLSPSLCTRCACKQGGAALHLSQF
jgi:hypothetical protein